MRSMILSTLSAATLLAVSCGPTEKEKETILQAQKAKEDSVRIAEVRAIRDEEAYKATLRDSLAAYNALLPGRQAALVQIRADIYAANDRLNQLKATLSSREHETLIREQESKIQCLIVQQTDLQSAIDHYKNEIAKIRRTLSPVALARTP